ncbi:MAG: hypothetical protein MZV70_28435 [Desulfobacterales bacterium]|nr:hypothetical protein [Desulfobacterales bacterium]
MEQGRPCARGGCGAAAGSSDYFPYVGPKEHDRLQQAGFGLEHIIDFGLFLDPRDPPVPGPETVLLHLPQLRHRDYRAHRAGPGSPSFPSSTWGRSP